MSDWDYINEHMGGHDEDGLPNFMSEENFSDEFREKGFYYLNHEVLAELFRSSYMTAKSVSTIPFDPFAEFGSSAFSGQKQFCSLEEKERTSYLHGVSDGWQKINRVLHSTRERIISSQTTFDNSCFLRIFPAEGHLSIVYLLRHSLEVEVQRLDADPPYDIKELHDKQCEVEWSNGFKGALKDFFEHLETFPFFYNSRIPERYVNEFWKHKVIINRAIIELQPLINSEDNDAKKSKLIAIAKEHLCWDDRNNKPILFNDKNTMILAELKSNDSATPTMFKFEPGDFSEYLLFEISHMNGVVGSISKRQLTSKSLKQNFSHVNGMYSITYDY